MSTIFTIYKIINKINGKVYIGYTSLGADNRFKQHIKDSGKKMLAQPIHRAIKKYGPENFIVEEICQSLDEEYTYNILEPFFIQEFKKEYTLYNVQPGGQGYRSNPNRRIVEVYDDNLELVKTFSSVKLASDFLSVHSATVSGTCRGAERHRASQIKGYYVCYQGSTPVKKDTTYLSELNKIRKPNLGKKRPEHSKFMKNNPPNVDNNTYVFIHKSNVVFTGTRQELITTYPEHKISSSELGVMIRRGYKSHRGWKLLTDAVAKDETVDAS